MPAKKSHISSKPLVLIISTIVVGAGLILIPALSSNPNNIQVRAGSSLSSPKPMPTFTPAELSINSNEISVGSKYGSLLLREKKPTTGNYIDHKSNLSVVFQGQIQISGKFDLNSCFIPDLDSVKILPRFENTNPIFNICFTNSKKLPKALPSEIVIDNFAIIKSGLSNLYEATYIKSN